MSRGDHTTAREVVTSGYAPYVPRVVLAWPAGVRHQQVDGTQVFVDISGFTKMSERLARKGKVGAEEVVAVLNNTFSALLGIADHHGGDLLKFGGDALLLFFTGDDHAARAVGAADAMRTELRTVGRLETSAGKVALRMSVGVHSGGFDFFLVGESHHELISAGPATSLTVAMESTAAAGEILLSPATADLIPARRRGAAKGEGLLLRGHPTGPPWARPDARLEVEDASMLVPEGLRNVLATASGEGEHRRCTVGFVKFTGTDDLVTRLGPDEVWERLDRLVAATQRAAGAYGVTFLATDIDQDGGKLILTAGVPIATDSDEERMLLALHRVGGDMADLDRLGFDPLHVKIGVNRGNIFAADVGAPFRRAYTVIGDAVNLAARVMAKAEPGQLLATREVLNLSRTVFATTPLEPFTVKGKKAPVDAAAVGAPVASRDAEERHHLPLSGRDPELAALVEVAGTAPGGRISVVVVEGPAGTGKSRLAGEARERTPELHWLKTSAEQYEQTTPYVVFRRLLRQLIGSDQHARSEEVGPELSRLVEAKAPDLAPWLPLIAVPAGADVPDTPESSAIDEAFRKDRTHDAVASLLRVVLGEPAALVFDNAQWMDDVSGELLDHLIGQAGNEPWLVCILRRPGAEGYRPAGGFTGVELGPLDDIEALELVAVASGDAPLPVHKVEQIIERSGGNPLFLLELLDGARAGAADELPDSIEALVSARIDRLDPELRKLLRYGAAVGRAFEPDLLAEAAGDEVPAAADEVAWGRLTDFLERGGDGSLRFRQNIFRDVAYEGLPFRIRKMLHRRIGEVIEVKAEDRDAQAGLLSLHFSLADEPSKAWGYSVRAGDEAREQYANVEAAEYYRRALAAGKRVEGMSESELGRVAEALGDVEELAGLYDEADQAFGEARRYQAGHENVLARLLGKQGLLRERSGRYVDALRFFGRGLQQVDGKPAAVDERARLLLNYAGVRFRQGRYDDAVARCRQVLSVATEHGLDRRRAHAAYLMAVAYTHLNHPERKTAARDALGIFESLGDLVGQANVLNNLGYDAYFSGAWDEALAYWERSQDARERAGDVVGAATQVNNIGEIYSDQGRLEEAERHFHEARRVWRAAGFLVGIALATLNLGRTAARGGHHDQATDLLEDAGRRFADIGAQSFVIETRLRSAEGALLRADPHAPLEITGQLLTGDAARNTTPVQRAGALRARGYALLQVDDPEQARAAFDESLELARTAAAEYEVALALEALARWGRTTGEPMTAGADEAAAILERLGVIATPLIPLGATIQIEVGMG